MAPTYFALARTSSNRPGALDQEGLDRRIREWNGSGDFTSIAYSVRRRPDGYTLWIDPQEKEWGPNYLQLGFTGSADSTSYSDFAVSAMLRRTWQNSAGAEWLTAVQFGRRRELDSRWLQPLSVNSPWFIEPGVRMVSEPKRVFVGNRLLGEFKIQREEVELGAGLQSAAGEARAGLVSARTRTEPSSGFTGVDRFRTNISGWRLRFNLDSLDELDFPRSGNALRFESFASIRGLGAASSYRRNDLALMNATSWGSHTLRTHLEFAQMDNGGRDTLDLVSTGGFLRLSGYQNGQFLSTGKAYGSLTYYHRVLGLPQPLGSGVFAGVSLETARIRAPLGLTVTALQRSSVAVFLGASTALGPAFVGIGVGQGGNRALYLFLGRPTSR